MSLEAVANATLSTSNLPLRFKAASIIAAGAIINEAGNTPNHANRLLWANAVIADEVEPDGQTYSTVTAKKALHVGLATNATLQGAGDNVDDNAVQFILNSILDVPAYLAVISS